MMALDSERALATADGRVLTARRLRSGDEAALRGFDAALSPVSHRFFWPHGYDDATLAEVTARSAAGDDFVLGLFDGTRMVGYSFLWYYTRRVPLLGIGLVDTFHGCGLGRQLLRILIDAAVEAGCEGVELTTMGDNTRAFALYRKTGFRYLGDVDNVQGDGKVVVERAMFYAIRPGAQPMREAHAPPV